MTPRWLRTARRIAVVRLDRLGDMFLTFPMFPVLREYAPDAELHLVCRPYTSPAAQGVESIDRVHTVPSSDAVEELEDVFRRERLDVVFFPLFDPRHAWAGVRGGVRHRVGNGRRTLSVLYNHWIFTRRSWRSGKHEAALNVEMVETMIGKKVPTRLVAPVIAPATRASRDGRLREAGIVPGLRYMVVHPGSGGSAPATWAPERFAEVARVIAQERQFTVLVTGSPDEATLVERVVRHCPGAISLAGRLALPELIALIADAGLVITNCTGPMHVATAYDTPVVGALPGTDVPRWHPLSPRGGWVASAVGAADLDGVTVEAFTNEVRRVLDLPVPLATLAPAGRGA